MYFGYSSLLSSPVVIVQQFELFTSSKAYFFKPGGQLMKKNLRLGIALDIDHTYPHNYPKMEL